MNLDVYDTDATTFLGTLSQVFQIGGTAYVEMVGTATFKVDIASDTDLDLLLGASREQTRRWVRFRTGSGDLDFAAIVQDIPTDVEDIEPESGHTVTTVTFQCLDALEVLGYREGGGVLQPYGGTDGEQQVPRMFGPFGFDHIDETRPEPTVGDTPTREGWPDGRAKTLTPSGDSVYRRLLTGQSDRAGTAAMWLTSAAWTEVKTYFDGRHVTELSSPYGSRSVLRWDKDYDGEEHVIFFDVQGELPSGQTHSLAWTWANVDADGEVGERLFTTYESTSWDGPVPPTEPHWGAWESYDNYPGVTVGFVMGVAVDEAQDENQDRDEIAMITTDFDDDNDSDGTAWSETIARGFRVQKLGHLADSLSAFKCEPHVKPDGTLQLFQSRGSDKSATVTVTAPFGLSMSGRGVQATRLLYETDGGFGEATNAAQETALGFVMADVAQFGEDVNPGAIHDAVVRQLESDAKILNELEIDLPDDVEPGVDVWLGDIVTAESSIDGSTGAVRITSLRFVVDDANGHVDWSATAEPQ